MACAEQSSALGSPAEGSELFRDGWLGPWTHPDRLAATLLPVIVTVGVALRFWWMNGPAGDDDTRYLDFALKFVSFEGFGELDHAAGRLLFLVLVGIPYRLFGHAFHAAAANVLYSAVTDVVVVAFCWRRLGPRAGLLAALLMAANPIHLMFPGMIFPDTLLSLFMLLSLLMIHRALGVEGDRARTGWIAGAGLVACFAYQCKDPGILLLPPVCALLFFSPREGRPWDRALGPLVFAAAFLGGFLLDGLVYWAYTGDFFYRQTATQLRHNGVVGHLAPGAFLERALDQVRRTVLYRKGFLLLPFHLGIPALAASLIWDRRLRALSAAGLFVALFLVFGSSSLLRLVPLPFQPRYFQPVIPLAVIALAGLFTRLAWLRHRWIQRLVPWALGLWVLGVGWEAVTKEAGMLGNARYLKSIRAAVELLQDDGLPFYTDRYTLRHLRYFLPAELYGRVALIPGQGELPQGYYFHYDWYPTHPEPGFIARVTGLSAERLAEIHALPVRVRSCLDARIANRFRQTQTERTPPVIPVYEKRRPDPS